jgi:hypothetical protein
MTDAGIDKFDVAQRQLDCAIRLWVAEEDSLAVHTLAYAASCFLRDLFGNQKTEVLRKFKGSQRFGEVPNFLKHADRDPDYILNARSKLSVHLTLAFAIRLWEEHGREKTPEMNAFSEAVDPFKPGHRASESLRFVRHSPTLDSDVVETELQRIAGRIAGLLSTDGPALTGKEEE